MVEVVLGPAEHHDVGGAQHPRAPLRQLVADDERVDVQVERRVRRERDEPVEDLTIDGDAAVAGRVTVPMPHR